MTKKSEAGKAYDEARASDWKAYQEAIASAWKAYQEAKAAAWGVDDTISCQAERIGLK